MWSLSATCRYENEKKEMRFMKKAGARIIMRGISMAWLNWHDVYSSAKGERDKMLRIGAKILNRELSKAWDGWRQGT